MRTKQILVAFLCGISSEAWCTELSKDQTAIVTSSTMLFAASKYCSDRYKIDEIRIAAIATMAGVDAKNINVKNKMQQILKQVDETVDKVGTDAYCDYLYGTVGGTQHGSLMLKR